MTGWVENEPLRREFRVELLNERFQRRAGEREAELVDFLLEQLLVAQLVPRGDVFHRAPR